MKAFLYLELCLVVGAATLACSSAEDLSANKGLDIKAVQSIRLFTKSGWDLTIFQDGSAKLQFGSGPVDNAKAPAGAIDFVTARNLVESELNASAGTDPRTSMVSAAIRNPGDSTSILRPLRSANVWNQLIALLENKLKPGSQERFDLLKSKAPLRIEQ